MLANVTLVSLQPGRGKTNRQVVPIVVPPGTDGPVIAGLECVTAHSFECCCCPSFKRQRLEQAEARAAQTAAMSTGWGLSLCGHIA